MLKAFLKFICLGVVITGSSTSSQVNQVPPDIVQSTGGSAKIQCSHNIPNYNRILWYKQTKDGQLTYLGYLFGKDPNPESEFKNKIELIGFSNTNGSMMVEKLIPKDAAVYFCAAYGQPSNSQAYFGDGTKLTVLDPNVRITPPTVKVFPPGKSERCDKDVQKKRKSKSVTLLCVASGFYPDHVHVSWRFNTENRTKGVGTDNSPKRPEPDTDGKMYSITSRLRVPVKEWAKPKNTFTCVVDFFNGTHTVTTEGYITGTAEQGEVDPAFYAMSAQTAKFAYSIFIVKSCVYGLFILIVVKKQISHGSKEKW